MTNISGHISDLAANYSVKHEDVDYNALVNSLLLEPLLSGSAYYAKILDFKTLHSHDMIKRYGEFGLSTEIMNGYLNDYGTHLLPYIVRFEFRYDDKFLENLKGLSARMSLHNHYDNSVSDMKDIRRFEGSYMAFGDFSLSYIDKEGWYGMSDVKWDFFETIRLEHARTMSHALRRLASYLYFSFVDSNNKSLLMLYSDFRDYCLVSYEEKPIRKISKMLVNTTRHTFGAYQVEPLSPMALSYKNRLFFLSKRDPSENVYAFIIFLSEEEVRRTHTLKIWANAER